MTSVCASRKWNAQHNPLPKSTWTKKAGIPRSLQAAVPKASSATQKRRCNLKEARGAL